MTTVTLFEKMGKQFCDGVRHYSYLKPDWRKVIDYEQIGFCDGTSCLDGTIEEVEATNLNLPQMYLVDQGLRIRRGETIYVQIGKDGIVNPESEPTIPTPVPNSMFPVVKGGYLDLPNENPTARVVNPDGKHIRTYSLEEIERLQELLKRAHQLRPDQYEFLILEGYPFNGIHPVIDWGLCARKLLIKEGHINCDLLKEAISNPHDFNWSRLGVNRSFPTLLFGSSKPYAARLLAILMQERTS